MPVASTVPLAFVWVKCPMPLMMALGWTLNSPSPVIATRSPFGASETFGSSSRNAYVWVPLSASAVAGKSIETASVRTATSTDSLFMVPPLLFLLPDRDVTRSQWGHADTGERHRPEARQDDFEPVRRDAGSACRLPRGIRNVRHGHGQNATRQRRPDDVDCRRSAETRDPARYGHRAGDRSFHLH